MATVYMDKRRATWYIKYRTAKGWKKAMLGRHPTPFPPARPPKNPPLNVMKSAAVFQEQEREFLAGIPTAPETPIGEYLEAYADSFAATHRPGSSVNVRRAVRRFAEFCRRSGAATVQQVTRATCRDYLAARYAEGISSQTLKTDKGYIAPAFSRALEDELIASSPWRGVRPPGKAATSRPTYWTGDQVDAIASHMKGWKRDLTLWLANTGLRIAAGLATSWDWIDEAAGVVRVPAAHDKGGRGYSVPLNRVAREVLDRRSAGGRAGLIFGGRGNVPFSRCAFSDPFDAAVKAAGVPHGTPHDLRHTFGRSLCAANVPINAIKASLGHASLAMTQVYTDIDGQAARDHFAGFSVGGGQASDSESP